MELRELSIKLAEVVLTDQDRAPRTFQDYVRIMQSAFIGETLAQEALEKLGFAVDAKGIISSPVMA